jgi:hypothetical protein
MIQEALPDLPSNNGEVKKPNRNYSPEIETAEDSKVTLIEFPGGAMCRVAQAVEQARTRSPGAQSP